MDAIHRDKNNVYVFKWYRKNIVILPNGMRPSDLKTLAAEECNNSSSSSKVKVNDEYMINELAEEYLKHLACGKRIQQKKKE